MPFQPKTIRRTDEVLLIHREFGVVRFQTAGGDEIAVARFVAAVWEAVVEDDVTIVKSRCCSGGRDKRADEEEGDDGIHGESAGC